MAKSEGILPSYRPLLWAAATTTLSMGITLVASRHFKQIAEYQRWAMGASVLAGIAAYRLTKPREEVKKVNAPPPQAPKQDTKSPPKLTPPSSLPKPRFPISIDLEKFTRENCERFEEALKRGASSYELKARLKQILYALSCLKELPDIEMLQHLVVDKQPTPFAQRLMQGQELNGQVPAEWAEALKEETPADLKVRSSLAGPSIQNRQTITAHQGTLFFKGDMGVLQQVSESHSFQATSLIIEANQFPDLSWIEMKFPRLKQLEIRGLKKLTLDKPYPFLEKITFPDLCSLTIQGTYDQSPLFLFTAPLLEELILSNTHFEIPLAYLPLLNTLKVTQAIPNETLTIHCPFLKTYQVEQTQIDLSEPQARVAQFPLSLHCLVPTPEQLGDLLVRYPKAKVPQAWHQKTSLSLDTGDTKAIQATLKKLPNLRRVTFNNGGVSTDILYGLDPKIVVVNFPKGATSGSKRGPLDPTLLAQICHLSPFRDNLSAFYEGPFTGRVLFQIPASKKVGILGLFHLDQTTIDPVSSSLWLANGNYQNLKGHNTSSITTLMIEDIESLQDSDLVAFVKWFPNLQTISLQRCPKITSSAIQGLLEWWLPKLSNNKKGSLNLTGCVGIDDMCRYSQKDNTDFNLIHLQLVLDETPLSGEARKDLTQQKKSLNGKGRVNLLEARLPQEVKGRNYDEVRSWYQKNEAGILEKTQTDLSDKAKKAYLRVYHTDSFPVDTSLETLFEVYNYAKITAPSVSKRIERLLAHQITEANLYGIYDLAMKEKLPALKWAAIAYAITHNSPQCSSLMKERVDLLNHTWDDFTVIPHIPGTGEDIPLGNPLTFQRLALMEGTEYWLLMQPGYDLYSQDEYGQSDEAFKNLQALTTFRDYLYKGKTDTPLDLDLAYAVYGLATRGGFQRIRNDMTAWATNYQQTAFDQEVNGKLTTIIKQI